MRFPSHPAFAEAMFDLRVLGIEPSERGDCYGLVAARSNPRWWILPLSSSAQTRAGLELFHPATLAAQVIKSGAAFACSLGLQRFAFRSGPKLTGVRKFAATFPIGTASSVAIFTGTEGPHRKTTVQFSDYESRILGYAKLSRSPQVTPWIEAEARILKEVAALHLETADTPSMLDLRRLNDAVMLITDSKKERNCSTPRALTKAHVNFITELAARTAGTDWPDHVESMRKRFARVRPVMGDICRARVQTAIERLSAGPQLPVVLTHGDFTPWNSFLGRRLYVFDWEYAGRRALGHDIVHFIFATRLFQDPLCLEAAALAALGAVYPDLDATTARLLLLAYLCNHTLLFAQREYEGLRRIDGWMDSTHVLPLIDRLLQAS